MKYDEVWSYSADRIIEYFANRGAVSHGSSCSADNCSPENCSPENCSSENYLAENYSTVMCSTEYYSTENCTTCKCSIEGVAIQLIALDERTVGPINLPQTRVIIAGDNDADVEKVYHDFYLHFLSGGA